MNKSDVIFGVARENAPPRRPIDEAEPVSVTIPGFDKDGQAKRIVMTFAEASMLHYELGQTLARKMRVRGSATPPTDGSGGTPVAVAA